MTMAPSRLHESLWSLLLVLGLCCSCLSVVTMVSSAMTAQCRQEAQLIVAACEENDLVSDCCAQLGAVLATDPECYCDIAAENSSDSASQAQLLRFMRSTCLLTVPADVVACLSGEAPPPPDSTNTPSPPNSIEAPPPPDSTETPSDSTGTYPPPMSNEEAPPPPEDVSAKSPPSPRTNNNPTPTSPRLGGLLGSQASPLLSTPFAFITFIVASSLL